ncbi:36757_t:CDS:1, partial [Racocetra persica]
LNVKDMYTTDIYSTIQVSFSQKYFRNLFIWNKEISNKNDFLDLYKIISKFTNSKWLIVGNSLTDDNDNDLWVQFQKQTNKKLKKHISYSSEYEIFDILKEEISLIYAIYKKIKADQKDLF